MMNREQLNKLSKKIIGIAIDVHKTLGPGFVKKIYEKALISDLKKQGISFENQKIIKVSFREQELGQQKVDFLIEKEIIVELKSTTQIINLHRLQLLSYLKTENKRLGLILNFGKEILQIKRIVNSF